MESEELVAGVLADLDTSQLPIKEKLLLRFVVDVNEESPSLSPDDMQPLYEAGWDDEAIYDAITVCALFNFYNRWIDATGVHALSDDEHRVGARRMAQGGYIRTVEPPASAQSG